MNGSEVSSALPKPTSGIAATARAPPSSARRDRFVDTAQCQMPTLPAGDAQSSGVPPSAVISWLPRRRTHRFEKPHQYIHQVLAIDLDVAEQHRADRADDAADQEL